MKIVGGEPASTWERVFKNHLKKDDGVFDGVQQGVARINQVFQGLFIFVANTLPNTLKLSNLRKRIVK